MGITISAIIVILGSAFTLLGGAMMVLSSAFLSKANPASAVPLNLASIVVIDSVVLSGFGGWGLASGIGLIYLKRWARISTLIFAGFLVCIALPAAAVIALIPLPNTHDPNLPSNFMSVMRIGMSVFYGMFAALGAFWLYFFNTRSAKAQFQPRQPVPESAAGDLFLGAAVPASALSQGARPLSITIIGWFLLIGSAVAPLGLVFNRAFFPGIRLPLYFLGFFFLGRSAYLVSLAWMAAQMVAAAAMLKLKKWGLFATIGLQCLAGVNAALLMGIPGHRARFQQMMETMTASMNARLPEPAPFVFPAWIGLAMAFPVILVILWFLVTRRRAFASAAQELAPGAS